MTYVRQEVIGLVLTLETMGLGLCLLKPREQLRLRNQWQTPSPIPSLQTLPVISALIWTLLSFRLNHLNNVKVPETGSLYLYKVHTTKIWAVGGIWRKHMVSMKGAGWYLDYLGHLVFSCSESLMIYSVIKK